jgi:hypothetical protein
MARSSSSVSALDTFLGGGDLSPSPDDLPLPLFGAKKLLMSDI